MATAATSYAQAASAPPRLAKPTAVEPIPTLPVAQLNAIRVEPESDGRQPRSVVDLTRRLLYVRYKTCDRRIESVLASLVPTHTYQAKTHGVNGIVRAVDYIVEHSLSMDRGFFSDLKMSIRDRRNMAAYKYCDGDKGHAHLIEVWEYCWVRLLPLRKAKDAVASKRTDVDADADAVRNRFGALSSGRAPTECDDDENDDDEMDLPQGLQPRPQESVRECQKTFTDVLAFLYTLEELMFSTALHFERLPGLATQIQQEALPASAIVNHILEASVAANVAIQQVVAMEIMFIEEHPHLNTAYRMLAKLKFRALAAVLGKLVTEKSPLASKFSDKDAIAFLGDAMECAFRSNTWDPGNKSRTLVAEFLDTWQFADDKLTNLPVGKPASVQGLFQCVSDFCVWEVGRPEDSGMDIGLVKFAEQAGLPSQPCPWLGFKYIGNNRSITSTFHLVQMSTMMAKRNARWPKGTFGVSWGERTEPATRIQVDMDELLMHDILPSLTSMCREGVLTLVHPFEDQLLAGFVEIKNFVKHPERPVSWALAFTVHTILTAIFETQGFELSLAQTAQFSFLTYIQQLDSAKKTLSGSRPPPVWEINENQLLRIRFLPCGTLNQTRDQILLSTWNPYCAGCFLSYIAYNANVNTGRILIDSVGQLHVTMHLFNALQQVGAIRPGDIKVLDRIFNSFKSCPVLWKGSIPVQGQFKTCWKRIGPNKKFGTFDPALLSKSYRRVCLLDLSGSTKRSRDRQQPKEFESLYEHLAHIWETTDSISDDSALLATNLASLGTLLNDVYFELIRAFDLIPKVEGEVVRMEKGIHIRNRKRIDPNAWRVSKESMTYDCMSYLFGRVVLRNIDEGDERTIATAVSILKRTFEEAKPESYTWFAPQAHLSLKAEDKLALLYDHIERRTNHCSFNQAITYRTRQTHMTGFCHSTSDADVSSDRIWAKKHCPGHRYRLNSDGRSQIGTVDAAAKHDMWARQTSSPSMRIEIRMSGYDVFGDFTSVGKDAQSDSLC